MRLGQLLTNLATITRGPEPGSLGEAEDEELIAAANRLLASLRERRTAVA